MKRLFSLMFLVSALFAGSSLPARALEFDRLRMLTTAEHVPWRAVGRVNISTTASLSMCTGTLIGENLVLTAAHCVMNPRTGKAFPVGLVDFVAGWRRGQKVGHSKAAAISIHPDYMLADKVKTDRLGADLALIRLTDPIPQDKAPSFMVAPPPQPGTPLTLISYRRDRPHALTRQKGCQIIGMHDAVMAMNCNVTFGASGSPVFMSVGGEMHVVAVVAAMGMDTRNPVAYAVLVEPTLAEVLLGLE